MKSNYIKSLFFSIMATCGLYLSCNEKKLDLLPHGPTEANFFAQESDFTKAVYGIYAKMSDIYWFNSNDPHAPMIYLMGDDITTNQSAQPFEVFGPLQPSNGDLQSVWATYYQMIARSLVVLEKIAAVKDDIYTTPNLKNYHKGEALFMRGWAYYNLWNYWGTAPLRNERVIGTDQFYPAPTTGTQLLEQAIKDFTEAAELLPGNWDAVNRGRVTTHTANGMLGKALVFKACVTKNNADYTAAIAAFNKITGLSLVPNFDDNFAYDTENNSESLFEFQASQPFTSDNVWISNDFDNAIGSMSAYWGYYSNHWSLLVNPDFMLRPNCYRHMM